MVRNIPKFDRNTWM